MQHVIGEDRNQFQIIYLEQLVPENSWARVIDLFVDLLPLAELGFKHSTTQNEGRPPYDPAMLLKLYLYGYKYSIRSSRKLEHACKVNVELWWLLKGLTPSFRTIAYFRKENSNAFTATFKRFVLMLKDLDLIEGETIAIDSFKIFAQNSIRKNFTQKKIDRHLDYIDKKVAEYEAQLDESDAEDKAMLKEKIQLKLNRRKKYEELNKALKDSGESQISLTDKDARALMLANNISGIGFNIQAAADAKNKLLIHSHI
ncbi:MAG: transposase, partial [Bacteroidales bacterium]|nr:transposase [Bacteroidales bacterium]